ncbi:DNA replication regulator sld2 [Aspergillus nanangensis]|uniref:DNA replication regulator SLD2 n=1 Tax=Aspergillus nanangensis TaxID=2582783 RepID=A0AAD4CUI7_ASPNN|nr:DNA replication regulator sld2 [Aspergillus nanangensis]
MATTQSSDLTDQSTALRAELKEWERAFAAANEGRKAGRSDIKNVPDIAAKYKEYSRLKSLESKSRRSKPVDLQERPKKRKQASPNGPENADFLSTPRKSSKADAFTTPSRAKVTSHPAEVDPYDSPSVFRRLFSPSTHQQPSSPLKTAIGPTPQRDGKALGLFDLLSESGGSTATPTVDRLATVRGAAAQTPSKRKSAMDTIVEEDEDAEEEESPRMVRTPASSGKKYMLSTLFATPTTWRYATMMDNENSPGINRGEPTNTEVPIAGPSESETPSFLRRSNSGRYGATDPTNGGVLSPTAVRKRPQFVGKGLSALVQGLRDMEEEQMQDDMDVLNEIEAEQAAMNVEVADSQMPENDSGQPFKKRGQKRTTRMVRMKPVISKPSLPDPDSDAENEHTVEHDQSGDEAATIPETQHANPIMRPRRQQDERHDDDAASLRTISEPDLDSDADYEEPPISLGRSKSFTEKMKEAIGLAQPPAKDPPEKKKPQSQTKQAEKTKPRERKIDPQAHANYRSLKIRNRGSKGRGAGRFRRR